MKAIDCAATTTKAIPALKKAGITHVIRYFGAPSWKDATKAECDALKKAGIGIASVYETVATMVLQGRAAGVSGAKTAKAAIISCGGPSNPFVYFACDTNTTNFAAIAQYLAGAASVLGANKVGIYGSYEVCANALFAKSAAKAWQTKAWSANKRLTTAALYQDNGSKAYGDLGISYDVDLVQAADFGQWGYAAPVPVPVPVPVPPTPTPKPPAPNPAPAPVPKPAPKPEVFTVIVSSAAIRAKAALLSKALVKIDKGGHLTYANAQTSAWYEVTVTTGGKHYRGWVKKAAVRCTRP